jgi:hypothetical protein
MSYVHDLELHRVQDGSHLRLIPRQKLHFLEWNRRVDSMQTLLPAFLADTLDELGDELAANLPDFGTSNRFQWIDGDNNRNNHRDKGKGEVCGRGVERVQGNKIK